MNDHLLGMIIGWIIGTITAWAFAYFIFIRKEVGGAK